MFRGQPPPLLNSVCPRVQGEGRATAYVTCTLDVHCLLYSTTSSVQCKPLHLSPVRTQRTCSALETIEHTCIWSTKFRPVHIKVTEFQRVVSNVNNSDAHKSTEWIPLVSKTSCTDTWHSRFHHFKQCDARSTISTKRFNLRVWVKWRH